ncbi:hypothetical protein QMK33_17320 [Hymenobacter sp. H14-R3]|nr:hypothetical protein [Hymenobacter sp. H14-R3]
MKTHLLLLLLVAGSPAAAQSTTPLSATIGTVRLTFALSLVGQPR